MKKRVKQKIMKKSKTKNNEEKSKTKNNFKISRLVKNNNKGNGVIIGHALGDAIGAPVEFFPYPHYTGIIDTPIIRYSQAYGKQISALGQTTDDTEMAIVLMETINSGYTKDKAIMNYMLWANNKYPNCKGKSPFMGNNTRKLFVVGGNPSIKLYMNRFKKYFPDKKTKENAQSNGPLMRAYPFAFINDESHIRTDVYITNPSELCYNATLTYVRAIKMAISGKSKLEIKTEIRKLITHQPLLTAYDQACSNTFRDVTGKSRGYIAHAYYCAFGGCFNLMIINLR